MVKNVYDWLEVFANWNIKIKNDRKKGAYAGTKIVGSLNLLLTSNMKVSYWQSIMMKCKIIHMNLKGCYGKSKTEQ